MNVCVCFNAFTHTHTHTRLSNNASLSHRRVAGSFPCSSLNMKQRQSEQITQRQAEQAALWAFRRSSGRKPPLLSSRKTPPCSHKSPHMLRYFAAGLAVLQQQPLIKLALLTSALTVQLICSVWLNKQGNTSLRGCQTARTLYICWPGAGRRRAKC